MTPPVFENATAQVEAATAKAPGRTLHAWLVDERGQPVLKALARAG